jgi:thiamine biosynthesis lipoprotein
MKKIIILITITSLLLIGCQEEVELIHTNKFFVAMNTVISYQAYAEDLVDVQKIVEETIFEVEETMSRTDSNSEVYRINSLAGTGDKHYLSDELADIIETSIYYQEKIDSLFRISIFPLVELWDIMNPDAPIPTKDQIRQAIELSSVENIEFDLVEKSITIKEIGAGIDLGGIAKGYAADLAIERLKEKGVLHGFISLGGGVQAFGGKSNGDPWVLGLQNPIEPESGHFARYEVFDGAVVTSGDYQRYKEVEGIVYHHIIDPRDGYPVQEGLASVTVFTESSTEADAYSTAFYVMGFDESMNFIENNESVNAMFVFHDKSVYLTEGLRGKVQIVNQEFYFDETRR